MTLDEVNMTIDYLKEMQESYIEVKGYERHPLPEWYALDKAIEALEQTRWIPVSERLPEKNGQYLVTVKEGYMLFGLWCGIKDDWRNVIAWMPLPDPIRV